MRASDPEALTFWSIALRRDVVRRAVGYGVVVGSILVAINHGDALLRGDIDWVRVAKLILTPLVPYCVSTLFSGGSLRDKS